MGDEALLHNTLSSSRSRETAKLLSTIWETVDLPVAIGVLLSVMRTEATATSSSVDRSPDDVGVLVKTIDILEVLGGQDEITVAELCRASGVKKAAAYRILNTLERRGYVRRGDDDVRHYSLGPALRTLAQRANAPGDLLAAARPALRSLWEQFGETVNLGVMSGDRIVYLDILESDQGLRTTVEVGASDDLHATALGKAMLAAMPTSEARLILSRIDRPAKTPLTLTSLPDLLARLDAIRTAGYSLDDEENEMGARCVAAVVSDRKGRPIGAMSVSGPTWRMPDDVVQRIGSKLIETCAGVAEQMQ